MSAERMDTGLEWSTGRYAFAALAALTLSPVVLHGLWRPLAQALHTEADAFRLSCSAILVATVAVLVHRATQARPGPDALLQLLPGASAVLASALLGLLLGDGATAIGAVTASLASAAVFSAALLPWLLRRLPAEMDGLATRRRGVAVCMLVLGVGTVAMTARLSAFMGDASRSELSLLPEIPFFVHHSCLTAYVEGERLATEGADNLYDTQRWPDLNGTERSESWHGPYAPFGLDAFAYPPPFLLLPRMLSWSGDFPAQRALWFALNGLFVAAGLWTVAAWLGGRAGLRALLLAPLIWVSSPTLGTLQVGNVHLAVMVAAMLALVAFETRRHALGGGAPRLRDPLQDLARGTPRRAACTGPAPRGGVDCSLGPRLHPGGAARLRPSAVH